MDAFPDVWDNHDLSQFHDSDFLALLQKQFPPADPALFLGAYPDATVNPQTVSAYPLPSLTPPSEDSSPSPPGSNQDNQDQDGNDYALKRKASDDDFSDDGPTQKSQNTGEPSTPPTPRRHSSSSLFLASDKKGANSRRKSTGNGKDEGRLMKRKEQNRAAQRAFRERKEKHVKDLEDKVADLEAKNEQAVHENENLRDLLTRLQTENVALKQSSFTFALPKTANSIPTPAESPRTTQSLFSAISPQTQSAASPAASTSSKLGTNPLDWSSLTSFDPAMLNLLDDTVPQPTATENAMQMDFGFGANTGLSSNAPYTTIASNPMFMSFASTFDNLSPEASSSSSNTNNITPSASGSFSGFNFDLSALQSWPTPTSSHDTNLDDLFSGYLGQSGAMDLSLLSNSPASISPVAHHVTPAALKARSPPASSSSSSSPSPLGAVAGSAFSTATVVHSEETCPKTKKDFEKRIENEGPSPFAPASLRKSSDAVLGTMIACAGSNFPKTAKSDKNIEVLSAWRSIRADPKFKDADINELCSEFTSKARCDGTKVVLEPQGVHSILESLSKKQ
ncbi:hypothetical protein BDN70DRAFT_805279 [Pholiota conissans]|uniref:BZIP domain-containing protein n=1 Tax=Pholiota conissans TaxID=109636 RepID=A0A9P5Z5I1_9AGAR|nr:hypothetical protein BDN70DRAFT_805279 [Pholiota conissans]